MLDRVLDARNSVAPGFGPGRDNPIALHTTETSVYRVTGMNQIQDIIDCGYVRPKGYGKRSNRVGNIVYWSKGNNNLFYCDKRPVIEVSASKVQNGQMGAISIDDLLAIWIFDEKENKYLNKLDIIKSFRNDINDKSDNVNKSRSL